jgi:gluconokinase
LSQEVVLGIDIGTTATKVVALDGSCVSHAAARRQYPLEEPHPGEAVQDPATILAAVIDAVREVSTASRDAGFEVAAVAFSSAMHSLIALDAGGRPLTPSITWADERATDQAERLRITPQGRGLHRRTGTPVHSMSPLTKLLWFRERAPDVMTVARRWIGIKEYVVAQLCGEHLVDLSIASGTGLLTLATREWDAEALQLAGIDASQLSTVVPTTAVLRSLRPAAAEAMGLDRGTPLVIGAGDGPLANLGVGAVRPGIAACSIGTSGAIRCAVDRPAIDEQGRVFCYALTEDRWVVGGAVNNGGVVLRWLGETLMPQTVDDVEGTLLGWAAQAPPGCGGLLMLPYLFGERAPHWSGPARGAYVGLTHEHRREHLVRAAIEGVCLQLAVVLDGIRDAGIEVSEMRATGGFARSPFWRQLLADVLDIEVRFPAGTEGSSVGAALLGMRALDRIDDLDRTAQLIGIDEVLHPQPESAAVYRALRPIFAPLYGALATTNRALHAVDVTGGHSTGGPARLG